MWLLKTIVISSILGISLGTTAGLTARLLSPVQTNIPQVQSPRIILASDKEECCVSSQKDMPTIGHEIIAAQIINGEEDAVPEVSETEESEVTESIQASLVSELEEQEALKPAPDPTPEPSIPPTVTELPIAAETTSEESKSGLNVSVLLELINQYRQKIGMASFVQDENLCSLAQARAGELTAEFANGRLHSGLFNRGLPYRITENAILMRTEAQAFQWWLNSSVHRGQMQGDFKNSCLACSGFQCAHVFTNFIPKN